MRLKTLPILAHFRSGAIGRHMSWMVLQSTLEVGLMTIAALLAARWFGPVHWGQLGIILTGVQLLTMLVDGFYISIIRQVSLERESNPEQAYRRGWKLAWVTVGLGLVASIFLGAVGLLWVNATESGTQLWVALGIGIALSRITRTVFDGAFRGHQEFTLPAIAAILCSGVAATGIVIAAAMGYRTTAYLAILNIGMWFNALWLVLAYRRRMVRETASTQPHAILDYLRYSAPLVLRGVVGFLQLKVNILILGYLALENAAGQFRLAEQFLAIPSLVLGAAVTAFAPRVVSAINQGPEALARVTGKVYLLCTGIALPLGLFFMFNAPLTHFVFPQYDQVSTMVQLFAPAVLIQGLAYTSSTLLLQGGFPRASFWLVFIPGLLNVVGAYIGYLLWGVMGMVAVTAFLHVAAYLATIVTAHRLLGLRLNLFARK